MKAPGPDEKLTAAMVALLTHGSTLAIACAHVGISTSTYYQWLARGQAGEEPYGSFARECTRAAAAHALEGERLWESMAIAKQDWKGIQALLRVRHPGIYGEHALAKRAEQQLLESNNSESDKLAADGIRTRLRLISGEEDDETED